jgi:hypothetical protein
MARRRTPNAPSDGAQRAAFYKDTGGKHYGQVHASDRPPTVYSDIRWVIQQHQAASHEEKQNPEGAPPKRDRLIAATNWLEDSGAKLSDAPGSRCVKELVRFLDRWETDHPSTGNRHKNNRYTAETLAGTLLAYAQGLIVQR